MKEFDYILLGTGQATGTLLASLLQKNSEIAVIESHKIGGSCVNYGCTPTKSLVGSARAIHLARRGADFGFEASPIVDFPKVMKRMNRIRESSSEGLEDWMKESEQVSLFQGFGKFYDTHTIEVNGEKLKAKKIFINTGTQASVPPIEGLESVPWLDSEGLLGLQELPKHLIIVGGGYIGVEFGQIFRRLGSEVTIIQRGAQLMPQEDKDVAASVQSILEEEGIQVLLNSSTEEVKEEANLKVFLKHESGKKVIDGSHLLIATGRKPNSKEINLDKIGIDTDDRGYIRVNDQCQTNLDHIYAIGDVNGQGAFTHTSVNDAEIVLDNLNGGSRKISDRIPIYALFTDPPLGRVGLSEKEAIEQGHKLLRAKMPMSEISRAKEMSETKGFAKLLVDAESDLILGAAIHGIGGDEIINMFAAIMHSKIPCREYRKVVLVHPTVSELMPFMLDRLELVSED